ncbi:MAG: hypothetical protein V1808_00345 [Candidatus Daviesbacteria bacterium]
MRLLKTVLPVFFFCVCLFLFCPQNVLASTLYLAPSKGSVGLGSTLTVTVRLAAGGDAVNAVSAFLSYPADKLEVAWVGYGGSSFSVQAESTYGGGIVKISRGSFSPVTGNANVGTIGFRGKALGSATVAFIGGSAAPRASDSSDSLNLGGSSGGTYNVVVKAPQPTGTGVGGGVQDNLGPKISGLAVASIATNSAVISWKTDEKATSYLEYGIDKDQYFLNISDGNLTLDHSLKIEGPLLIPGAIFHFKVKSVDVSNNQIVSEDQTFQLVGYKAKIKVLDSNGKPVAGLPVFLYSNPETGVTDKNGEVIFNNVMPGKHLVVVKSGKLEKTIEIEIKDLLTIQEFNLSVPAVGWWETASSNKILIFGVIEVITIVIITIIIVWLWRKKKKVSSPTPQPPVPQPIIPQPSVPQQPWIPQPTTPQAMPQPGTSENGEV